MSKLKEYLEECKVAYYGGYPIISDDQYDQLEKLYNEELDIGTPQGETEHLYKMYSLQKFYVGEELPKWPSKIEYYEKIETPKLDGAAIALRYLHGQLHSVVTRGNGEIGQDISHLFKVIHPEMGIPKQIKTWKETAKNGFHQITGEIVAPKNIENARNYAAGALNLKNLEEFYFKNIEFFAYNFQATPFESYIGTMFYLRDQGFNTVFTHDSSHCPTDGTVIRLDSNEMFESLGYTNKHPRGAYALKKRSTGVKTEILDVIWQTDKTGKVTPVALLKPINIDGAAISRATLNNPGFIEALDVNIGDSVFVERAGGIIPRIIKKAE
jgi:DNA ligase (NAD+)